MTKVKAKFPGMLVKSPCRKTNKGACSSGEEEVIEIVHPEKVNIAKINGAKFKLEFGAHKTMTYNAVWNTLPGYVMVFQFGLPIIGIHMVLLSFTSGSNSMDSSPLPMESQSPLMCPTMTMAQKPQARQ